MHGSVTHRARVLEAKRGVEGHRVVVRLAAAAAAAASGGAARRVK
jgi:hypothetical protein